jgi:Ca2+/Na+ antiporter
MDPIIDFVVYMMGFVLTMGGVSLLIVIAALYIIVIFLILCTMLQPYQPLEKDYDQSHDS